MKILTDTNNNIKQSRRGFSIVELVLVLFILILMLGIITISVVSVVSRSKYNADAARIVNFLQKSVQHAVLHQQEVEIYIDLESVTYQANIVFEEVDEFFTSETDPADPNEPEQPNTASDDPETSITSEPLQYFFIETISFEDGVIMNGDLSLHADGGGWQDSFIIALTNEEGTNSKWIRCDRGTANVRLYSLPVNLPEPRSDLD